MKKVNIDSFFYIKIFTRLYILGSIIILFYLSYNNHNILYKPIIFVFVSFVAIAILNSLFAPKEYIYLIILVFCFYIIILNLNSKMTFCSSYNPNKIVKIKGHVIKDISKTESGNYYFRIKCDNGILIDGTEISLKGQTSIISKKDSTLLFLTPVELSVEYIEEFNIYKAKDIKILSKNTQLSSIEKYVLFNIRDNRNFLIKKVKSYLKCPLSRMLILGRSDQEGFLYKNYALSLGCAHLLALSGMHLSIISLLFTCIFSKIVSKKKSRYVTLIAISYFLYMTGLIPSLIRSYIMYILSLFKIESDLKNEIILLLSGIIQATVFPDTFISAGCLFSYGALSAIFIYSSLIHPKYKITNMVLTTIFAILITYPLSLSLGGSWCILSIVLAPLLTIFITFEMILSLFVVFNSVFVDILLYYNVRHEYSIIESFFNLLIELFRETNFYFQKFIFYNERIVKKIFDLFENIKKFLPDIFFNNKGYLIFALIVLTTSAVYLYSKGINKIGVSHNELGLPI